MAVEQGRDIACEALRILELYASAQLLRSRLTRADLRAGVWDADLDQNPAPVSVFPCCGYQCEVRRNPNTWTYCGYVQLPAGHPCYASSTDDLAFFDVHGGVTYANGQGKIGIDFVHTTLGDVSPLDETLSAAGFPGTAFSTCPGKHYWTLPEAVAEVARLAQQLQAVEDPCSDSWDSGESLVGDGEQGDEGEARGGNGHAEGNEDGHPEEIGMDLDHDLDRDHGQELGHYQGLGLGKAARLAQPRASDATHNDAAVPDLA